jgi:hypothetical protein
MGPTALLSLRRKGVLRILSPLKSIVLGRVWTREPWSSGKHANHYTLVHIHRVLIVILLYEKT